MTKFGKLLDYSNEPAWGDIPKALIGTVIEVKEITDGGRFPYRGADDTWWYKEEWLDFNVDQEGIPVDTDDGSGIKVGNVVQLRNGNIGHVVNINDNGGYYITVDGDTSTYNKNNIEKVVADKMPEPMNVENIKADEEICDNMENEIGDLLGDFNYDYDMRGVRAYIKEWNQQKGKLRNIFSSHPNWDKKNQMIILKAENFKNTIDWDDVCEFREFFVDMSRKYLAENQIKFGFFTYDEFDKMRSNLHDIAITMRDARSYGIYCSYKGMTIEEVEGDVRKINTIIAERQYNIVNYFNKDFRFDNEEMVVIAAALSSANYLLRECIAAKGNDFLDNGVFTEKAEEFFKANAGKHYSSIKTSYIPKKGQSMTKYFGKLLRNIGADKFVDMRKKTWTDDNGVYHEREYDAGYNHYRAMLGDAMACRDYKEDVYISINPVDYLTSSFLYGTASCHTIDKDNIRRVQDSEHVYRGCNSSGTVSYGCDDVSVVVYTIKRDGDKVHRIGKEADPNGPVFRATKMRRMMAFIGEDKLVCSRVYPDGRDGGDETIGDQFRNILQKTIAECLDVSNMWTLKKGSSSVCKIADKGWDATCYPDWVHYGDVSVSYLRTIDGILNYKGITVGAEPICLNCGDRHGVEESIICDCCSGDYAICERCGERINLDSDDYVYSDADGYYWCDSECAENDDYVYCENVNDWRHVEDCFRDDYTDDWCYGDDYIIVDNSYYFESGENAENYGCSRDEVSGEWTYDHRDDMVEDNYTGELFVIGWHDSIETVDGNWYYCESNAEDDGYFKDENGEWRKSTEEESEVA